MAVIVDYPGTGEMIDPQGNIPVLTDQEALINAINLWVSSFRGERLYRPDDGGVIIHNLLKPMSDERANNIKNEIIDGLMYKFTPFVKVNECTVDADYLSNTYWIIVKGYCPALQTSIYDKIGIKSLV